MKENFKFWGEDEAEDRKIRERIVYEIFKESLNDPKEDEAWKDI